MDQIHPNARTTPAGRAAIAASTEPTRYVSTRMRQPGLEFRLGKLP
ncbi:hypothetical protein M2351_003620 [Azospirillum canadense]|nr:hypothetical protein [Azospirillum canadense]